MVIDALVEEMTGGRVRMDVDGEIASRGNVNMELLNYMMKHPYLSLKPPKTTGREDFGWKFIGRVLKKALNMGLSWEDIIATATYYTAKTISEAYGKYLPRKPNEIILGGGGSRNKTLVEMIRELNPDAKVSLHEDYGIPAQAKEPLIMTILANETLSGNPSNVPKATGATGRAILGKIILP
jgi:anhydro-N-acetylmuramic acid kinase